MRTIAFIPARCGSKSIPLKNIRDFCGKPLIYWNLEALEGVDEIEQVYVATDCDEIRNRVEDFGFSKVQIYMRELQNAQDNSSAESVMLEFIEKQALADADIFILVQATSPLTQSVDFQSALNLYRKEKADSLLTCARIKRFFWNDNRRPFNYNYQNRPMRQDFSGSLMENGAFYINTVGNIRKYKNRLSGKIVIYEMPEFTAVDIDEPDDWMIAERLMRKHILPKRKNSKRIKLFVTDVDGVLTDAGMYYSENGEELKKFNTRDGKGIELLRKSGIKTALITSEESKIVESRAKKLGFDYIFQGVSNKVDVLNKLSLESKISLDEVAYIGDDINDLDVLKVVGFSSCPFDAMKQNREIVHYVCKLKGGEGCVREFIEKVISNVAFA